MATLPKAASLPLGDGQDRLAVHVAGKERLDRFAGALPAPLPADLRNELLRPEQSDEVGEVSA